MLLEATREPIRYRLKSGEEITLHPGVPVELPDQAACQLLQKAPEKVRRVPNEPAIQPGCCFSWQGGDGVTRGPAVAEFVHKEPDGSIWVFYAMSDGTWGAVNAKYAITGEGATHGR
jgi:hypothetical protein